MATNAQGPTPGTEVIVVECNVNSTKKKDWDCCQLEQYCAKIDEVDDQVQRKTFEERPDNYDERRDEGNDAAKKYRRCWNQAAAAGVFAAHDEEAIKKQYYADCAHAKAKSNNYTMTAEMGEPDHIHEIQAGGDPTNVRNLRWLDPSVNKSVQNITATVGKSYDASKKQSVSADCCPAEATYCAPPKTSDSKIIS
ncbi:hypothetical protein [Pseudorhodoferax sp.]|uniref:hypothetical protein n=1 Tax=Pseudorhodoferax sp. TaxID=1993553 RepID=UPI0039E3261F